MSFIEKIIEGFDQSDPKLAEQKEAVRALRELGSAKGDLFIRDINYSLFNAQGNTISITTVVRAKK